MELVDEGGRQRGAFWAGGPQGSLIGPYCGLSTLTLRLGLRHLTAARVVLSGWPFHSLAHPVSGTGLSSNLGMEAGFRQHAM